MVLLLVLLTVVTVVGGEEGDPLGKVKTVLYLPLDERFTTRNALLNLAKATPFQIITPPVDIICHLRESAPIPLLNQWFKDNIPLADYLIVSAELFFYGGLIQSRISNTTTEESLSQLQLLIDAKNQHPNLKILLSTVIMRIEDYNGAFEDVWYWEDFGESIYGYSYYIDKYSITKDPEDLKKAENFKLLVPTEYLTDFLWRRQRNFNLTVALLLNESTWKPPPTPTTTPPTPPQSMKAATGGGQSLFERIYVTLDDNSEYGLNIREATLIKQQIKQLKIEDKVLVYPGADEVGLVMLSYLAVLDNADPPPTLNIVFRDPTTIDYIPAFEGQPMVTTLKNQITAAGGIGNVITAPLKCTHNSSHHIILLVNNFSTKNQVEAPDQPLNGSLLDYMIFNDFLVDLNCSIGMADNRYCNGADRAFISWMYDVNTKYSASLDRVCYAGWNTNGNTLGTVISNVILLHYYSNLKGNALFNSLRILEDNYYQSLLRQDLQNYVSHVRGDSSDHLDRDMLFYDRYTFKRLNSDYMTINLNYALQPPFELSSTYFPWNRTFEIGLLTY